MSIVFKNQIITSKEETEKIKYIQKRPSGRKHYHIGVWIEGTKGELDKIKKVEYLLHPTFKQPLRYSEKRENGFGINFWTYGWFLIHAKIYFKDGTILEQNYNLEYALPEFNDDNYIKVGD